MTARSKNKKENFKNLKIPDRKSSGVEIDPIPRGIIFNILGFPGGINKKKRKETNPHNQ